MAIVSETLDAFISNCKMDEDLERCVNMLKENDDDMRKGAEYVLLSICQNILSRPERTIYRQVRLNDPTVLNQLLPVAGAMECLLSVGFTEATDCFFLPQETSLEKLRSLQKLLSKNSLVKSRTTSAELWDILDAIESPEEKKFLTAMFQAFEDIMQYENPILQEKARKLIPIVELETATLLKMRDLQKRIKLRQTNPEKAAEKRCTQTDIDLKDLFLGELLHWFKYKFFTWVDSPVCPACREETVYNKTLASGDPRCSRIELYRCTNCETFVKFPRYCDPDPLLTSRCGRCGEWAMTFTLFCRALGYDARLVCDKTDHIWTEVWSITENRWIHVDPSENVMNRPLIYEKGWRKKLTYIFAYSKDEVQDVTWRYTRDQVGVMKRRNHCSESTLLQFIESLNKHRQSSNGYSTVRRDYVVKRRLFELVELIRTPNEKSDDGETYHGRSAGSYAWKLARGEIAEEFSRTDCSWDVSKFGHKFQLRYSVVKDKYEIVDEKGETLQRVSGWQEGASATEGGIFRKLEDDWKMVYLTRSPGTKSGRIKWTFEVSNPDLCLSVFDLRAAATVFHGASASWEVEASFNSDGGKNKTLRIPDCGNYRTNELEGATKLILSATVSGGQGDAAWQHAQLFRQSLENENDQSMVIAIQLKRR